MARIQGGDKLEAALRAIASQLGQGGSVRIGFLEQAKYPDGTPVALVAFWNDSGTVNAPPRPFFRNMIANKEGEWPAAIGGLLVANGYDTDTTLQQTGAAIAGQLRESIINTNSPPLARSTILRKGHSKPLIDTSHMINSVDFEVTD